METMEMAAAAIVRDAESRLRAVAGEALGSGKYECAVRLTDAARRLAGIAEQLDPRIVGAATSPIQRKTAAPKAAKYPRFIRKTSDLVKVGWSKRDRAEYQHKAPLAVLSPLISTIQQSSRGKKPIPVSDLLPVRTRDTGEEIPSYQIYVWLAWLRSIGLVEQIGRQGIRALNPDQLPAASDKAWSNVQMAD